VQTIFFGNFKRIFIEFKKLQIKIFSTNFLTGRFREIFSSTFFA